MYMYAFKYVYVCTITKFFEIFGTYILRLLLLHLMFVLLLCNVVDDVLIARCCLVVLLQTHTYTQSSPSSARDIKNIKTNDVERLLQLKR